jgi:hypothetical protein
LGFFNVPKLEPSTIPEIEGHAGPLAPTLIEAQNARVFASAGGQQHHLSAAFFPCGPERHLNPEMRALTNSRAKEIWADTLSRKGVTVFVSTQMRRSLRRQMITTEELMSQLRQQGVGEVAEVRAAFLEGDGRIIVIKSDGSSGGRPTDSSGSPDT